ncbi:hypothetical protein [Tardiphaga sp. 285_C5_N1_2]|uniref:hypothetical protein n=1 Tax=Tardiphaga sp. 285_C5_N1_2 TaxID=3240775 RepID=UPI003F8C67D0
MFDAEFNAVKLSLDETQQNIRLIQDDDGVLKRGSVGRAQLDSSISIGFAAPSSWQVSTPYDANVSTVFYASKFYICTDTHVSGPTFDATKWEEIADFTVAAIIDDGSITSAKLADGAVAASKIADGSISNSKLASGAVSTAKMADQAVTLAKLSTDLPLQLADLILPAGLGPLPWSRSALPAGWDWADGGVLLADTPFPVLRAGYISDGFPYGQDGSGNPKKPDTRGSVVAGPDGGSARLPTLTTLGARGGSETGVLVTANLPSYTPSGTIVVNDPGHLHSFVGPQIGNGPNTYNSGGAFLTTVSGATGTATTGITAGFIGNAQGGTSTPVSRLQPTLALPMIIKAH